MKAAYEKCKADGNISDTDVVELELHVLNSDDTYVKMVNFIDKSVKGKLPRARHLKAEST